MIGTESQDYVATTGGCSNLQPLPAWYGDVYIDSGTGYLASEDISEELGDALTCFKMNVVVNGKTYSTGPIALNWDGAEYTSATPNNVSVDFTK